MAAFIAVTAGVVGGLALIFIHAKERDRFLEERMIQARDLVQIAARAVERGETESLSGIESLHGVRDVALTLGPGSAAAGLRAPVRSWDYLSQKAWDVRELVIVGDGARIEAAFPVPDVAGGARVLRLSLDHTAERQPMSVAAAYGIMWLIGVLFSFLMARLWLQHVLFPLQVLIDYAKSANVSRSGRAALDLRTGDEFETLGRDLSTMMGRIDASMKRIQKLAFTDGTTELPNEERFRHELDEMLKAGVDVARPACVLFLSCERLPTVVDTLGREAGEELLRVVSRRMLNAVQTVDRLVRLHSADLRPSLLARTGTNEFALLVPDVPDVGQANRFAQTLTTGLDQPFEWAGTKIVLGVHAGMALAPRDGQTAEGVLRNARLALSVARRSGLKLESFDDEIHRKAQSRLRLETELRQALERGEFIAYFQPKVCLASNKIEGAEALARWRRPDGSIVSPAVFIEAAEEYGLIGQLGDAILEHACQKTAEWLRQGANLRIAVNVSALQFADDRFAAKVLAVLERAGLPAHCLELEVTESIAMSDPTRVADMIEPLRARGVRFAIDDFGAGHSSLGALSRLPFDVFKIDQQFVRGLENDRHAPALIETILAMAERLNFETVAEGVETADQADFLRRRGCAIGQGYFFGKPMPADEFAAMLMRAEASGQARRFGT